MTALIVGASDSQRAEFLRRLAELGLREVAVAEAATPLDAISLLLEYPEIQVVFGDPELSGALAEEFPAVRWLGVETSTPAPIAV